MAETGKRNVHRTNKHLRPACLFKHAPAGLLRLRGIRIIFGRDGRIRKLQRCNVNDVTPDQKLLAVARHLIERVTGGMARSRKRTNTGIQFSRAAKRLETAGLNIRPQRDPCSFELGVKERRRRSLVTCIEPVVCVGEARADDRIGERHPSLGSDSAHMVFMEMREEDLVDLIGPVTGGLQVRQQMSAARAVERTGSAIDEDKPMARIDQERVDRALGGRRKVRLLEERIRFVRVTSKEQCARRRAWDRFRKDGGVREGMRPVGKHGDFKRSEPNAINSRSLGALLWSCGARVVAVTGALNAEECDH